MYPTKRQVSLDGFPGVAVIHGFINMGTIIIMTMAIKYSIGCPSLKTGCFDTRAPCVRRKVFNFLYNIFPCFPAITGYLDISIVSSAPDDSFLYR
ncbi:hypothetical protein ES703_93850 [subsurface metagenome]